MKAILTYVVGVILFFSVGGHVAGWQSEVVKAKQEQRILSAAVMMTITTPNWRESAETAGEALPIPNDEYRTTARAEGNVVAEGLGTLVADGDTLLLVTHDHWSQLDDALGKVTFRAADGSWLADMTLRDFREHVRNRDGGIMVLTAPTMLKSAVPAAASQANTARLSSPKTLQNGDRGFVAQRAGERIMISEVSIMAQTDKQGRPALRLQSVDGQAVVGGDSGGGVWVNGRFVAAMWTKVMMENTTTGVRRGTDVSIAAVYQGV